MLWSGQAEITDVEFDRLSLDNIEIRENFYRLDDPFFFPNRLIEKVIKAKGVETKREKKKEHIFGRVAAVRSRVCSPVDSRGEKLSIDFSTVVDRALSVQTGTRVACCWSTRIYALTRFTVR